MFEAINNHEGRSMQWDQVLIPILILGATLVVGFWLFRRRCNELEKLAISLNGKVVATLCPPTIKGEYGGNSFEVNWMVSQHSTILRVALFCRLKFQLEILKKGLWTGVEHFFGKSHLSETSHHAWGPHYAVYSNEAAMANAFLRSDRIRQAIDGLFDLNFRSISIDGEKIYAEYQPTIKWESGGALDFFFGNIYAAERIEKARRYLLEMIRA